MYLQVKQEMKDKNEQKVRQKITEDLKSMQVDLSTRQTQFYATE